MIQNQNKILAIDVGNTNVHWCYMQDGNILGEYKRNRHTELSLLPWSDIKKQNCPVVIAGAILHINEAIETIARDYSIRFVEIDMNKQSIIKNTYSTLGIDRVCNLIASLKSFPNLKTPVVVFDFGTATTITACDQNGNFLGGMIKTGCELELKAISSKTLSLPHVQLAKEQKITKINPISKNTEDAILHGVIIGQLALIDYYLNLFKKEIHPEPKVIFTGGNTPIISRFLDKKCDLYDPHLTIKGIYHCYQSSLVHSS
ncbi:MAG: type III pantothenate kinase [Candidatus Melainabacteria bacterium]|nr:type III pantothenate kinase [Candidatus Melainabacteria bacterium]